VCALFELTSVECPGGGYSSDRSGWEFHIQVLPLMVSYNIKYGSRVGLFSILFYSSTS